MYLLIAFFVVNYISSAIDFTLMFILIDFMFYFSHF